MDQSLTIVVNSTDSYEDSWFPFFTLFKKFWPDCPYPIVLSSETKIFSYPGLDIRSLRFGAGDDGRRLTWSEGVLRCLAEIDTKYILWTLEDLFLTGPVDTARLQSLVATMAKQDFTHISLTPTSKPSAYLPSAEAGLWRIAQDHRYRISLLNGLWHTQRFMKYMRPHENPWQLEILGSRRAHKVPDSFYCVASPDKTDAATWPMPYLVTGITKGKWNPAVVPLLQKHGISMDFSRRGFHRDPPALIRRAQLAMKLLQNFGALISSSRKPALKAASRSVGKLK